jgi:hypothetical protein
MISGSSISENMKVFLPRSLIDGCTEVLESGNVDHNEAVAEGGGRFYTSEPCCALNA